MKKQYVENLQEGDVVNDYFVATRKDLRDTQSGGKFLGMVFKDRTGDVGGVMWNNAVSVSNLFDVGDIVNVRATVNTYQGRLQLRVDQVLPMKEDEYDTEDLVFTPENTTDISSAFVKIMETIENPFLKALVDSCLGDESFMEKFNACAAGKKWHHAFRGGLVQHCYEMARVADTMCELFPNLDRDMLLTGVFLHDIGKVEELSQGMYIDYTTAGKLVGHLEQGTAIANRKMDAIADLPETLRLQVLHMILSHHGELELGSPVVPKTLEAIVLAHIDNLDAQANAFDNVISANQTKGQEWSEYIGMIDRQIWNKDFS
ncbi:MAG: HD domain-containing protein [Candidatus Hydrogenedentota bacterium]